MGERRRALGRMGERRRALGRMGERERTVPFEECGIAGKARGRSSVAFALAVAFGARELPEAFLNETPS